jgi:3D (Asp-Asp-Asp) domain-containing protein
MTLLIIAFVFSTAYMQTATPVLPVPSCEVTRHMDVKISAYNSLPEQTTAEHPALAAWGDTLTPGMNAVAVSRDLIPLGLSHRVRLQIEGLEGDYLVLDKMNKRWKKKVDIYMGVDVKAARQWGVQTRTISWVDRTACAD